MNTLRHPVRNSPQAPRVLARAFILTLLGIWMGAGNGWALQPADGASVWAPSQDVEEEVRKELAQRWSVLPSSLVLQWGRPRGGQLPEGFDVVELIGHGKDGRWVVAFREFRGARDAASVLLRAGVEVSVPVARRALERGRALGEGDLEMEVRTHWGSLDEMPDPCALGWVTQRRIEAGELLVQPGVKPPLMVESGRPVQALWTNGRVELKLKARAMGSGSMGQRVYVRTEDGTRLDGVVQGPGLVVISNSWMERGE